MREENDGQISFDEFPPYVTGRVESSIGPVPRVATRLTRQDRWGTLKARWGVGRMNYTIPPGLYAVGSPSPASDVFVSANYKMSFDRLREALDGRDGWILVIDTAGINVWCAAGKGTFGTSELVKRMQVTRLAEAVTNRRLIVPQLGAPGVSAHEVKKASGFKVIYGPIQAADLPAFLDAGLKATPEMRRKTFGLKERFVLIPVELVIAAKAAALIVILAFLFGGIGGSEGYWIGAWRSGLTGAFALALALLGGTVLVPILLPWLPGRAFSIKALPVALAMDIVFFLLRTSAATQSAGWETAAWLLLIPALTTYLAMSFTGATTFTSLSGVKKEMRAAMPIQIGIFLIGTGLWIGARFAS